jgi:hypothetical protein
VSEALAFELPGDDVQAEVFTERTMLDRLHERYSAVNPGNGPRYVCAEHVRSKLGFAGYHAPMRTADFIAADKWPSSMALHGHEVKVSRGDWLRELRDPDKAETFKRYMHYWWLVVPDASIVKPGELPEGWGLMALGSNGRLRARKQARTLFPEPLPLDLAISFAAAAAKTAQRRADG